MDRNKIICFLTAMVRDIREQADVPVSCISEDTVIFGKEGVLTSLMLVELMLALEDFCTENGIEFVWASDSAMSQRRSVYRTVASLTDFVLSLPRTEMPDDAKES